MWIEISDEFSLYNLDDNSFQMTKPSNNQMHFIELSSELEQKLLKKKKNLQTLCLATITLTF